MAIPDTSDAPLYQQDEPDWSASMHLSHSSRTDVFVAHNGSEQRILRRESGKREVEFSIRGIGVEDNAIRHFRALAELRSRIVVPIWPLGRMATWSSPTLTLEDGLTPEEVDIETGIIVYVREGSIAGFHEVSLVSGQDVTLLQTPNTFSSYVNPLVIPCMDSVRSEGMAKFEQTFSTSNNEMLKFSEL